MLLYLVNNSFKYLSYVSCPIKIIRESYAFDDNKIIECTVIMICAHFVRFQSILVNNNSFLLKLHHFYFSLLLYLFCSTSLLYEIQRITWSKHTKKKKRNVWREKSTEEITLDLSKIRNFFFIHFKYYWHSRLCYLH